MKRARLSWVGVLPTVTAAAIFAACSSSSGVSSDGGTDGHNMSEAGPDMSDEMLSFDTGSDSKPADSPSNMDSPTDQHSEVSSPDGPLPDTTLPDGTFDGPEIDAPDVTEEEIFSEDFSTEDVPFEGGSEDVFSEDIFDSGFCALADAETTAFPAKCSTCLRESCCAQITACDGDTGCKSIGNCIGQCLTMKGTNCEVTCYDAGDAGKNLASQLINCMNSSCNSFEKDCE
jgi:hypothetical protein